MVSATPIPASCTGRPTTPDGLVIPWANVQLADGGCDFRSHHNTRWLECWERGLCQVCGEKPHSRVMVLLCGPRQLRQLVFDEPPLHPACAKYVTSACPMVAGQRSHYRAGDTLANRSRGAECYVEGCECGGWVPTPGRTHGPGGDAAHEWYAVYVRGLSVAVDPGGQVLGGVCSPEEVVRVQLVSVPGVQHQPWLPVADWLDRYEPPATSLEGLNHARG